MSGVAVAKSDSEIILVPADYFFWFLVGITSNVFLLSFFRLQLWQLLAFLLFALVLWGLIQPRLGLSFLLGFFFSWLRVIFLPLEFQLSLVSDSLAVSLAQLRQQFSLALAWVFPEPVASFSQGIITGNQGVKFEPSFWQALKLTSTVHLVAVSGYNITLVARGITRLLAWLTVHRKLIWLFALAGIFIFTVFVGAPVSAIRAGIMAGLLVVAERFGRAQNAKIAFAFVLSLMGLINPLSFRDDLSFQLSFLASFGVLFLAPRWSRRELETEPSGNLELRKIATETLAAQLLVFPVLISRFGTLSLVGMLVNLLVLPLIPLAMGLSFLTGLGVMLQPVLGQGLALLSLPLLTLIIWLIKFFAQLPLASLSGLFLSPGLIAIYYGLILLFILKNSSSDV